MPQLIAIALIGGLGWYAYKAFKKEMARVKAELDEAEAAKKPSGTLEADEDGVYRPKDQG